MRGHIVPRVGAFIGALRESGVELGDPLELAEIHNCLGQISVGVVCLAFRGQLDGAPPALVVATDPRTVSWLALSREGERRPNEKPQSIFETPLGPARVISRQALADDDEPMLAVVDANRPTHVYFLTGYVCP